MRSLALNSMVPNARGRVGKGAQTVLDRKSCSSEIRSCGPECGCALERYMGRAGGGGTGVASGCWPGGHLALEQIVENGTDQVSARPPPGPASCDTHLETTACSGTRTADLSELSHTGAVLQEHGSSSNRSCQQKVSTAAARSAHAVTRKSRAIVPSKSSTRRSGRSCQSSASGRSSSGGVVWPACIAR